MLTAAGIAAPLALKAIGAIAFKALILSSVALTVAGIIALKKIYSNEHHEETTFQVHASGEHRRNALLMRNSQQYAPTETVSPQTDPYRYYYEYPSPNSA